VLAGGGTEAQAADYLTRFFENAVALPGSGRDATSAFSSGTGDVLLSYENEAILARQNGEDFDYIVPDTTLLIENPGAVTVGADPKAKAWLDYVLSPAGQATYARFGFRPVTEGVDVGRVEGALDPSDPFPTPKKLLTIADDFGGWPSATKTFVAPDTGLRTKIQQATGTSS
jgi:sulfate transport system substrate-binding protein